MVELKKGDIVLANLQPIKGSEQGGIRPCLVIQNDISNMYSPLTIIAAITSKKFSKAFPTNVDISKQESKLDRDSTILLNQLRTIDKMRIVKKIGFAPAHIMKLVNAALKLSLSLE